MSLKPSKRRKRHSWTIGDIFVVQCKDGKYVIGQIVGQEQQALNSVTVAFHDIRVDTEEEARKIESMEFAKIFSIVFATRESLDFGQWKIIGHQTVRIPVKYMPYENLRNSGFIGAKIIGSGILDEFINAFYALTPWDNWHNPAYLDELLLSPDKKPSNLIYKTSI